MTENISNRNDVNVVVLTGYLGKDPVQRFTPNGKAVTSMSIAVQRTWTDGNGETQRRTSWTWIEVWGKIGEACHKYLKKGRRVLVRGELQVDQVEDRYYSKVVASSVTFLDAPKANDEPEIVEDSDLLPF